MSFFSINTKNKLSLFVLIAVISGQYSCSTTSEDVCDCLKNGANEYIEKGVRPTQSDLKELCKDLLDDVKDKAELRPTVEACGNEVIEAAKQKNFSPINGKPLPEYPTYTYENLKAFLDELYPDGKFSYTEDAKGLYKVWKSKVIIKSVYLGMRLEGSYQSNEGNFRKVYKKDGYFDYGYFVHNIKKTSVNLDQHYFIKGFANEFIDYDDYSSKPEISLLIPIQVGLKDVNSSIEAPSLTKRSFLDGVQVDFNPTEMNSIFKGKNGLFCFTKADIVGHYYGGEGRGTKSIFVVDSIINIVKKPYPGIVGNYNKLPNSEQSTETQPESESSDNSNLIGEWKGVFGNDQLALTIETVNADGSVSGFNIVKSNRRPLTGSVTKNGDDYNFELKEPGDDKWDGVFKFSISGNTASGNWTANNGKSTKQFSLTK
jgi:hypothetical protein